MKITLIVAAMVGQTFAAATIQETSQQVMDLIIKEEVDLMSSRSFQEKMLGQIESQLTSQ